MNIYNLRIRNPLLASLLFVVWILCGSLAACGQNFSQFDSEPLLAQARNHFSAGDNGKGEVLIFEYIREKRRAFPQGYTFGLEACTAVADLLNEQAAFSVIRRVRDGLHKPEDAALRAGVEAALLNCCTKFQRWDEGLQLIHEFQFLPKTNFVLNVAVLDFSRMLVEAGKTNGVLRVLREFYENVNETRDGVMPAGFWAHRAAETALSINQPSDSVAFLEKIKFHSPEYYNSNAISIHLLEVSGYDKLSKNAEVAKKISLCYELKKNGYFVSAPEEDTLKHLLEAYRRAGWLDANYRANPTQVYVPRNPTLGGSYPKVTVVRTVVIMMALAPVVVIALFGLRRRVQRKS